MFHPGIANTFFTELSQVRGSIPACAGCGKPLSKNLSRNHWHSPGIIAFWFMRCPKCRTAHIVFNETKVLPPVKELAAEELNGIVGA